MKLIIAKMFDDLDLLNKVIATFLVRALGALSIFSLNYIVAKSLAPVDAGYFFWALSGVVIITQLAIMGFHDVALKYISQTSSSKEYGSVNFISNKILLWVGLSSLSISFFLIICSSDIAGIFFGTNSSVEKIIVAMIPGIFFGSVANLLAFQLQAVGKPLKAVFILSIAPYLIFSATLLVLESHDPFITSVIYTLSCAANVLIAAFWWRLAVPTHEIGYFDIRKLWSMAIPMWVIAIMAIIVNWGGQFISGIWVAPEEVALYAVALRAAALINFFLVAVNFIVAPKIAKLHKEEERLELQLLITNTIRILYLFACPVVVVVAFYSGELMAVFGDGYEDAGKLLLILALGQTVNVVTGPVGYLLTMTGNERLMRNMYVVSGVACIALLVLLVPLVGIQGAAWATSFAVAFQNIGATYIVHRRIGVSISPFLMFYGAARK